MRMNRMLCTFGTIRFSALGAASITSDIRSTLTKHSCRTVCEPMLLLGNLLLPCVEYQGRRFEHSNPSSAAIDSDAISSCIAFGVRILRCALYLRFGNSARDCLSTRMMIMQVCL